MIIPLPADVGIPSTDEVETVLPIPHHVLIPWINPLKHECVVWECTDKLFNPFAFPLHELQDMLELRRAGGVKAARCPHHNAMPEAFVPGIPHLDHAAVQLLGEFDHRSFADLLLNNG